MWHKITNMLSTVAMVAVLLILFIPHTDGFGEVLVTGVHNIAHTISDKNVTRALGSGSDSGTFGSLCCLFGNCSCPSLYRLLANLSSNVMINVISDVTLSSVVLLNNKSNIAIRGYNNPTVYCSKYGGLHVICLVTIVQLKELHGMDVVVKITVTVVIFILCLNCPTLPACLLKTVHLKIQ